MVDLGSLAPTVIGCDTTYLGPSVANAINADGDVVGQYQYHCDNSSRAFFYSSEDGSFSRLARLSGFGFDSSAVDLNKDHALVGWHTTDGSFGGARAVVWRDLGTADEFGQLGTITDIGLLGIPPGWSPTSNATSARALDINPRGDVVGRSITVDETVHGFLHRDGVMTDLGVPAPFTDSAAVAIAESGVIALNASLPDGASAAYIGRPGDFTSIGSLGGSKTVASDISARGLVVGWATTAGAEETHALAYVGGEARDLGPGRALGVNTAGTSSERLHCSLPCRFCTTRPTARSS